MKPVKMILIATLCCTSGCLLGSLMSASSKGMRLKTTNIKANDENWGKLEATATQIGWTFKKGGSNDYRLTVTPASNDGKLQMDYNRNSYTIDYVCEGSIKDGSKCTAAANKLFGPAFGVTVKD